MTEIAIKFLLEKLWPLIQKHWRLALEITLVILLLFFFWRSRHEADRARDAEQGRDAAVQISSGLTTLSHKYKNKQGDTVLVTKIIGIPKSQVDDLLKEKDLQWLKKFEGLKKDGSNLQSGATFGTDLNSNAIPEKIKYLPCKDSIKAFAFDLHNQWSDIHALVIDTPRIEIKDRYYIAIELKRPKGWFFKFQWSKREPLCEITNANKLIKIDSALVITVKN